MKQAANGFSLQRTSRAHVTENHSDCRAFDHRRRRDRRLLVDASEGGKSTSDGIAGLSEQTPA
ncbi:Hypothetical protein GbCGDNIH2_5056 [Granulibacter bethesdensis]|uniref:Uncharacterized protein n=1 Tax=Granulibacter bethesdensis (strain ATCC BAA-1260 / CGDNIH1) TaxID=391165 RepID=A0A286M367_GRABC|nr:Hypothetical protein GbCGDNIH4_5056 [Granulibacter bethesdensis CGDNIH4]AHJ68318.1 Hypothetical protein GbCGDNIH2_5056 [Granulibacter bethesdensis]APH52599.1 Hypothetical protein GbCGDNIH5_5056 [Granulibacter bethesdensis]APH65288.1 Hypothetical protein GbCGDNIH1I4_5056 [Granulibacter bethesdensis]ASV62466.1 Hypothetical protein GbCGDNIH1_5056 [Granulibacter bethesdensis CGDNIH1]